MSNVAVPAAPQSRSSNGAQASQSSQGQKTGHQRINKVAVLGAGTMGARIAAHFANAGVPCVLLDIVTPDAVQSSDKAARRKLVASGLDAAVKSKPAAFFEKGLERLIMIGTFEDDMKLLADVDWIIEAVAENLEIKRWLLKKVEAVRKPGSLITTNTSGLPVASIAQGFSEDFRRHWFGTHFFNPPRYMRLLEIIPTPETDPAAIETVAHFCDVRMGKGIVTAKDTPNFIANRIGTFAGLNVFRIMQEMDLTIEEVDALTSSGGWTKAPTFRTIDLVGLDVLNSVVTNFSKNVQDERSDLKLPDFFKQMLEKKLLGDKVKAGFYKKIRGPQGEERLAIDWKTLEYHPAQKPKFPALEMARNIEDMGERLRTTLAGDPRDKATQFIWTTLSDLWTYSANRIPEIADTVVEIDQAMRMGFNWEVGPFEIWDLAGVERVLAPVGALRGCAPLAVRARGVRQAPPHVAGGRAQILRARLVLVGGVPLRHRADLRRDGQHESHPDRTIPRAAHLAARRRVAHGPRLPARRSGLQGRRRAVPHVDARRVPGCADSGHRVHGGVDEGRRVRRAAPCVRRRVRRLPRRLASGGMGARRGVAARRQPRSDVGTRRPVDRPSLAI